MTLSYPMISSAPLAWEPPYAAGVVLKKRRKKKTVLLGHCLYVTADVSTTLIHGALVSSGSYHKQTTPRLFFLAPVSS